MGRMLTAALTFAFGCMPVACGKGGGSGRAIGLGTYHVSAPVCVSTGESPVYPTAAHKAALLDFEALTAHTLTVNSLSAVETLSDSDCTLTIKRGIFRNHSSDFSMRRNRQHTFVPEGCTLTVRRLDVTLEIGQANGAPFVDSDLLTEEIPYEVSATAGGLDLTTRDIAGLSDLWGAYGCAALDRLRLSLGPLTATE